MRVVMLEVTKAEVQAVRTFIIGAVCPKMSEAVALKTGFPVVGFPEVTINISNQLRHS